LKGGQNGFGAMLGCVAERDSDHDFVRCRGAMAKQLELKGHTYWILSEPHGNGWKASVVELGSNGSQTSVGIDATAETRGAADEAAERKLRRLVGS
jgi:hypothetical protein